MKGNDVTMIGIIGAMDEEVNLLKDRLSLAQTVEKASMKFYQGKLGRQDVVVVRSGVGKVNAGICAQILADLFNVDAIINTGIAGSLHEEIGIGDIVISADAIQHDVNALRFGFRVGQIPYLDTLAFQADEKLSKLAYRLCREINPNVKAFLGRIVSGDQFIADSDAKARIRKSFEGLCTEMEGAAIAQAAYLNNIPFVIIRAISDKADNSAEADIPVFMKMAAENSLRLTEKLVENYEKG